MKPGYKQTEVGVIPEEWEVKKLGEVGESLIGLTYNPLDISDQGILVLRSSNIQNDSLSFDDNVFVNARIPDRIMIQPGDVLICVRNGSRALIGKAVFLDDKAIGMTFGAFMSVYRSKIGILVNYLLQSSILKKQIDEHLGATINQITNKSLNSFQIPLPPLPEQRAIAATLSDVDALLGGLERLITKKRDLKQAAMQQLLTGQTRLPGFDGAWEVVLACEIGVFRGGSGFSLEEQGELDGEYPFFKVSDMNTQGNETFMNTANHRISENTRKKLGATVFPTNAIVLAKVGAAIFLERKKILAQPSCIDNNMAAFVLNKNKADVRFIHTLLLNKKIGAIVATSALPSLNAKQLGDMLFNLPPLPEQIAIAAVLSDMDAELDALSAQLAKTRALKQGMMQELLTGRTRLIPKPTESASHAE